MTDDAPAALECCLCQTLAWSRTVEAEFPYAAELAGQQWLIRINDFPAEPLYTLIVDGCEIGDFDDWPPSWQKPDRRPAD
ncbi:MAG: hypothetical protein GC191_12650 [Azospirillum sp.]|nr:hypothetical protein [Azospirillum sp.]